MEQLTVLVVDDDKITTSILSRMLDSYADKVIVASDGIEGLALYKEHKPEIVLSDINMPRMGGLEMVEQIRKLDDQIKIAIFTNFEKRDILLKAIQYGVNQFFSKPFEAKHFSQVIQPLCDDAREKKRIRAELNRQQNILHAINEMSHSFLQQTDWTTALYQEMLLLKQAAETSAVFIYKNSADYLSAQQFLTINDNPKAKWKKKIHYKKNHLMRWKKELEKGSAVNGCIKDYDQAKKRLLQAFYIDSLLILPIFVHDEWWGFLGIGNNNKQAITETDVEMLSTVSSIIGSAINNNRNLKSLEMSSTVFKHTMDVVGKDPKLLKSGTHDKHFYNQMWERITTHGYWQGEITNRKKNGEIYIEWLSVNAIKDKDGNIENFIGIFSDVTHQRKDAQNHAYLATHDPLTGLSNRLLLNDRLEHAINHADRFDKCVAAIFCDLDNFKPINDTYGHSTGDEILKNVANAMKDLLRKEDTICRFGGDEFVILVEELESFTYLEKILEKIRYISTKPFNIEGVDHSVGMSIGTAIYPNDANSAEDLLKCADEAMYRAKKSGKNKIEFFQSNPLIYANNRAFLNNLN
jgi:diguanylate cyclase (GGDEF)-like protein